MNTYKVLVLTGMLSVGNAYAGDMGSASYCSQLAEIGANAYQTKQAGYSMSEVLQKVGYVLKSDTQKQNAAQGVIIAIYGDSSIRSSSQAYSAVYKACKR
jgi:hypothetical protein